MDNEINIQKAKDAENQMRNPFNVETFMDDKDIRRKFVSKVYSILTIQVLFSIAVVATIMNVKSLSQMMMHNVRGIVILCTVVELGLLIALTCVTSLRRTFPLNYIMLFLLTFVFSIGQASMCIISSIENVYTAAFLTAGLFILLTALACSNAFDITDWSSTICWSSVILFALSTCLFGAGALFGFRLPKPLHIGFMIIVLLFVMVYIVYDTQLILGEGKVRISEEEYVLAALYLYIDLLNLFSLILSLVNSSER